MCVCVCEWDRIEREKVKCLTTCKLQRAGAFSIRKLCLLQAKFVDNC